MSYATRLAGCCWSFPLPRTLFDFEDMRAVGKASVWALLAAVALLLGR